MTPINFLGAIVSHVAALRDEFVSAGVGRFVKLERTGLRDQPWHIVSSGGVGHVRGPREVWISGDPDTDFSPLRTAGLMLAAALLAEVPALTGEGKP